MDSAVKNESRPILLGSRRRNPFKSLPESSLFDTGRFPQPSSKINIQRILEYGLLLSDDQKDCIIMRRKYSTIERRVWNKRYSEKMRKLGWIYCSFHVPKSVGTSLKKLKCELMARYKNENAVKMELAIKIKTGTKRIIFYSFKRVDKSARGIR